LAIGAAIAGDVDVKLMYAMIGQRNSGKGMLMTAVGAAFGNLVDTGKSANNLLGCDNNTDEAKKYMRLARATINSARLLWTNEVRTLCSRGDTYIDGNRIKGIASGGDPIEIRKQYDNPYPARHDFTMILNANDLPPSDPPSAAPSCGSSSPTDTSTPLVSLMRSRKTKTSSAASLSLLSQTA
jgi:phage/plasmid-associated DNA primase